jgi:hypothetical protein
MAVKHPESKALVEGVRKRLEARNARDLAAKLGLTGLDDERRVRSWLAGDTAPNFYGTMALLRAGGMLAPAPSRRRALDVDALAAALEELADLQERQDAVLERLLGHAVEQAPPRGGRRKRAG